jgi:hypothetical protein
MPIGFKVKDIIHKVLGKFVHAWLPTAKKPYNPRAVFQPELDVHGVASKAEVYNIETDPKVIEEGFNELTAGFWFDDRQTTPTKAQIIAVNEPKTLKVIIPADLKPGRAYTLHLVTQSSSKGNGGILKTVREVWSDFKLAAQN